MICSLLDSNKLYILVMKVWQF